MQGPAPQKIIIDTDPGIDDAMAIHQAFADPRLEVVGLTTIFGNVTATRATREARQPIFVKAVLPHQARSSFVRSGR